MGVGRSAGRGALLLALLAGPACAARPAPAPAPAGVAVGMAGGPTAAERLALHLSGFMWPLPLRSAHGVISQFGPRAERHHDGLDLRAPHGEPIFAARDGTVRFSGEMRGYGLTVVLDHGGGVTSLYAHASTLYVRAGEPVARGQVIAETGATGNATGPHLHFEIAWAGVRIDPLLVLPRLAAR